MIIKLYITHTGDKWVVHAENGKVLGTHKTKAEAEKQLQAIHISQHKHTFLGKMDK